MKSATIKSREEWLQTLPEDELNRTIYKLGISNKETNYGIGYITEYSMEKIEDDIKQIRESNKYKGYLGYHLGDKVETHIKEMTEREFIREWYEPLFSFKQTKGEYNFEE